MRHGDRPTHYSSRVSSLKLTLVRSQGI